jgi:hypothetical protein
MKKSYSGFLISCFLMAIAALVLFSMSVLQNKLPALSQLTQPPPITTAAPTLPPETRPAQLEHAGQFRYHFTNLNEAQQAAYLAIFQQLDAFPESISIQSLTRDEIAAVFQALMLDQPLLFHISSTAYKTINTGDVVTAFLPQYRISRTEYRARCEALATACAQLSAGVSALPTEFDRELALHDALVRACVYDETSKEKNTAYGALVLRRATCEGYAKAMMLLLQLQGMEAYVVTGNADNSAGFSGGHAWNKVNVEGAWYYLDSTWDDPVTQDGEDTISHTYFNLTGAEMARSHELNDTRNPCTATAANYFIRSGLQFSALDRAAETTLAQHLAAALETGDNVVELRMTTNAALETAVQRLFQRQRIYRVLSNADLNGSRIKADTVYHAEMPKQRVIRIMPILK